MRRDWAEGRHAITSARSSMVARSHRYSSPKRRETMMSSTGPSRCHRRLWQGVFGEIDGTRPSILCQERAPMTRFAPRLSLVACLCVAWPVIAADKPLVVELWPGRRRKGEKVEKVSGTVVLWFLPWTALGAEEGFQTKPLRHAVDPRVAAVRLAAVRTATQGLQLALALGPVQSPQPVVGHADRPLAQHDLNRP